MKYMQKMADEGARVNHRNVAKKVGAAAALSDASRNGAVQRKLAGMIQCTDDPLQRAGELDEEELLQEKSATQFVPDDEASIQ